MLLVLVFGRITRQVTDIYADSYTKSAVRYSCWDSEKTRHEIILSSNDRNATVFF